MIGWRMLEPGEAVANCYRALGKDARFVQHQITHGQAFGYAWEHGTAIVRGEGAELVLVAYEGKNAIPAFEAWAAEAEKLGFGSIRFHSTRTGMARLAIKTAEPVETIFRRTF